VHVHGHRAGVSASPQHYGDAMMYYHHFKASWPFRLALNNPLSTVIGAFFHLLSLDYVGFLLCIIVSYTP
jgi:hypothetical protein